MSLTKIELVARLLSRSQQNRRAAEAALAARDLVVYERASARAEAYELAAYDAEELEEGISDQRSGISQSESESEKKGRDA